MGIERAFAVPHPPLIIPAIGKGSERGIAATIEAYKRIAQEAIATRPDALVLLSSHTPAFRDAFYVSKGAKAIASMANFGAPEECFEVQYDEELANAVRAVAQQEGISTCGYDPDGQQLDHASFIPLWFLRQEIHEAQDQDSGSGEVADCTGGNVATDVDALPPVVRIGLSWLPFEEHRKMGHAIASAIEASGKRVVLVASGDLSHRLLPEGPYGYREEGPIFDELVTGIFQRGALEELFEIDDALIEGAGECGLRPFMILAGALEGHPVMSSLLSYEGPFGVGYAVASFTQNSKCDSAMKSETDSSNAAACADAAASADATSCVDSPAGADAEGCEGGDPYVALARASVEHIVSTGKPLPRPHDLPAELLERRAGAFVSLHARGDLRGCIGTISACEPCLADEIIANGISAAMRDPRFPAVRPDELDSISYSVDVLGEAESVTSMSELNPVRYGVIVTKGYRRGLLLPNLDGIETVERQLSIARAKAGIAEHEIGVTIERFEVVRHTAGGEARDER